ncbi:4'-phosphopantetheinyl transferase family protein [Flavisolibacter ginsenosidimutans]|uniref:Enterobactin synthase component D n=1 Tax=Flavisolibacter ginsenosidimutans TaxID=661481 RepID=A0A5B8UHG4_9BACT|nr:4'-phosphopantetheinyl transferase superfamily protein [Flavisolibacter ginsenosidimutans]QEC55938.1 4'-phosphopantetheinyl transferase superfamily protein [Flavisolibacter ginsenosidimutans]
MPIFFQHEIDEHTRLAVWKIVEDERFFLQYVPLHRAITHPHKRLQHLAGRYLLQYLFPDFPINLIKIADTRKPYLEDEAYHFSISHCSNYAAAIVSKAKRVGVDIEVPTVKVEKIKHKFLHEEELNWQSAIGNRRTESEAINQSTAQLLNQLTLLWSAKEAVFKWWSYGAVDFSEMIRLQPFGLQPEGMIEGAFVGEAVYPLQAHYKLFDGICLAWIAQDLHK